MPPYLGLTESERREIFSSLGLEEFVELEADVPEQLWDSFEPEKPPLSEQRVTAWHQRVAADNTSTEELTCFLGGGVYDHHVPSTVNHFLGRSEFLTAYTPYQAEINQGILQALFEFQTMVSRIYDLPVTNASMYDGASALAEAILMAAQVTRREVVYCTPNLYPGWWQVLKTYTEPLAVELRQLPSKNSRAYLPNEWPDEPAAVCMAYPNCWGAADRVENWVERRPDEKCLGVAVANPLAMNLLTPPGELGFDVAVGEGQSLGLPMNGGGPGLGLFSATEKFIRKVPGRLVGQTEDRRGNRCYVLTLQTREQHIRRSRATSNICTNHALMALGAAVSMATLGGSGLRRRALENHRRGQQLADEFEKRDYSIFASPFFNEVAVELPGKPPDLERRLAESGWLGGYFHQDRYICSATERRSPEQIAAFVEEVDEIVRNK